MRKCKKLKNRCFYGFNNRKKSPFCGRNKFQIDSPDINTLKHSSMKTFKFLVFIAIVFGFLTATAQPSNTRLYYGLLHAHTLFSDGSGTPEEAYLKAKNAGLNFFAITEHNHNRAEQGVKPDRKDGILIANDHALYNGNTTMPLDVTIEGVTKHLNVKSLKKAAEEATSPSFLALYGQEFSTISSGNHMNVLNAKEVIELPSGDFKALYDWVESTHDNTIILQMNHPNVHGDMFGQKADKNDYGIDEDALGNSFDQFTSKADRYIQLIEILTGPAMKKTAAPGFHYPHALDDDYFFYLTQGFHIAPSAGQDNHYKTWGTSSDARIGVYATALTKEGIADAFRSYRTFVTEDKNLSVIFSINNSFMGSSISAGVDDPLKLEIKVADTDDQSTEYTIEIYGSAIEPTSYVQAAKLQAEDGLIETLTISGNGTATFNLLSSGDPQFYYIKVIENDGDRAWTSPIWINHTESGVSPNTADTTAALFFWTKNPSSHVYHIAGCSSINSIRPGNLMSGAVPPDGRHQHDCNVPEDEDGH